MRRRFIYWKLLIAIVIFLVVLFELLNEHKTQSSVNGNWDDHESNSAPELCNFPQYRPYEIEDYPDKRLCPKENPLQMVYVDENGYFVVNKEAVQIVSHLWAVPIACAFSYFDISQIINRSRYLPAREFYSLHLNGEEYSTPARMDEKDFASVRCYNLGQRSMVFYRHAYAHGTLKNKRKFASDTNGRYSSLVMVFEGVSWTTFRRYMPQSYEFLTNSEIDARVFRGFTKVADDANSNLISLLSGKSTSFLDKKKRIDARFIWDEFSKRGFATTFHEDIVNGLFTSGQFEGVVKPTDFYYLPYYTELDKFHPRPAECDIDPTVAERQLDAVQRQLILLNNTLHFTVVYMSQLFRENATNLQLLDDTFSEFLHRLNGTTFWDRTMLFLIGNEGPTSYGLDPGTLPGVFKERMPLLMIRTPRRFLQSNPAIMRNLEANEGRLLTHFDLFETFRHLAQFPSNTPRKPISDGLSLFGRINDDRTCSAAGIVGHLCPCQRVEPVDWRTGPVKRAGELLVARVNNIVQMNTPDATAENVTWSCSTLRLLGVLRSERVYLNDQHDNWSNPPNAPWTGARLRIVVETIPRAIFEAELVSDARHDWRVDGIIRRLDRYSTVSQCSNDSRWNRYCVCVGKDN